MESWARTDHIEVGKSRKVKESLVIEKTPDRGSTRHSLYDTLHYEDCEDFYNYLDWLHLASNSKTLVIPRDSHFYYSAGDLNGLELLVNLKCLNKISTLNDYLYTLHANLTDYSYLTGCFHDSNIPQEEILNFIKYLDDSRLKGIQIKNNNSAVSWFSNKISRLFNNKEDFSLNRDLTRKLLKMIGFTVLDMTEINGLTYFCAQKRPSLD